jgi:phenylacetate-coenzyme A ligase PaaK-like adenylate-forming protein
MAQSIFEKRNFALNLVTIRRGNVSDQYEKNGYKLEVHPNWGIPVSSVFKTGKLIDVTVQTPNYERLARELLSRPRALYHTIPARLLALVEAMGEEKFQRLKIEEFISTSQEIPEELRRICNDARIRVRDTYTCEEVGPIGFECPIHTGVFHIATSNVIVECAEPFYCIGGQKVGRLLITHLHSYSTPFIRYEIGDVGAISEKCECGHCGPVISRLLGRTTSLLRSPNGTVTPFFLHEAHFKKILSVKEWRMRQTESDKLVLEIVPFSDLGHLDAISLSDVVRHYLGSEFRVDVVQLKSIDWGPGYKRLMFKCEIPEPSSE